MDLASVFVLPENRNQSHGYELELPRLNTVLYRDFPAVACETCLWNSLAEVVVNVPSCSRYI